MFRKFTSLPHLLNILEAGNLTLGGLRSCLQEKSTAAAIHPSCWQEHPAGSCRSSEKQSCYRSSLHTPEPEPGLCHGNRSCLHAMKQSVHLKLLFSSHIRIHMPCGATLTRWYGSAISSSKKTSSPPSPCLVVGSSVSHNVVFILGKAQGEILL